MIDAPARHPGAALALAAVLTVGAVLGMLRIEPEVDFVDAVPQSEGLGAYRELLEDLDGVRFVAIYMADATGAGLRSPDAFDRLIADQQAMTAFLENRFPTTFSHQLSALEGIKGGHYMLEKIATAGNPRAEAYSVPDDPVRYQVVRDQALGDDTLDDVLAQDGSSALMLFFFATDDNLEARALTGEVAEAIEDWPGDAVTDIQASGLLYASQYTDERNGQDLRVWGLVAAGAAALALLWVLRPSDVLLAVLGMGVGLVWAFGLIGALGIRISFLTLFLAPVVAGIGIDAGVHLLHRAGEHKGSRRDAVATALRRTGPSVALAAATTAAGLAVLLWVPNPLFAQIGGVAAMGVLAALLSAWLVVMPLRVFVGGPRPEASSPLLARFARRVQHGPAVALGLVALLSVAAIAGASQVRIESGSSENEFPQDDPVIRLQQRIEDEYGAFQRAYVIVRGDLTDPAALRTLHDASAAAADLPLFREASSVADLLLADEATDQGAADIAFSSLLGPTPAAPTDDDRLPATPEQARDRLDALFADPLWRTIAPFTITRGYDLAVVAVTVDPWDDQQELVALRDALEALAASVQERLPGHDVDAGGAPANRAAVIEQTPINVAVASLGVAFVVGVVLSVVWAKRGREGFIAAGLGVGVVLLAALWLLASVPLLDAFYAATGSDNNAALTDMFLLAFAITVAVGVDDLVHLVGRFWEARDAGISPRAAMQTSLAHAGRAVTGTTLTTFVAFAVLGGVYFLQSKNLAILTASGVAFAYLLTLLTVPALLGRRAPTP